MDSAYSLWVFKGKKASVWEVFKEEKRAGLVGYPGRYLDAPVKTQAK